MVQMEGLPGCGRATAVETCHWQVSKSRLSSPSGIFAKKNRHLKRYLFFLVQMEGLEPSRPCEH